MVISIFLQLLKVTINVKAQDDKYLSDSCALGYRGHIGTEEVISNRERE